MSSGRQRRYANLSFNVFLIRVRVASSAISGARDVPKLSVSDPPWEREAWDERREACGLHRTPLLQPTKSVSYV
jgi:hypothetical protein